MIEQEGSRKPAHTVAFNGAYKLGTTYEVYLDFEDDFLGVILTPLEFYNYSLFIDKMLLAEGDVHRDVSYKKIMGTRLKV